jgi:hypothetical protein
MGQHTKTKKAKEANQWTKSKNKVKKKVALHLWYLSCLRVNLSRMLKMTYKTPIMTKIKKKYLRFKRKR